MKRENEGAGRIAMEWDIPNNGVLHHDHTRNTFGL